MSHFVKNIAVAASVIFAVSTGGQAQVIYGHENTNLSRANSAMMAGDLEVASLNFKRAIKANLGSERLIPALNNYCAVEYAINNLESAEKICSEAIGKDRRYWRAYVNRGNVRAALGKMDAARADFEKAVKLKPGSRLAQNALASFQKPTPNLLAEVSQ